MDESFKLDLSTERPAFKPMLEELESGTWNFKIVAAYPHETKTGKKTFKFELLALDANSPLFNKTVHKLNFLSNAVGKNILCRELKAVGVWSFCLERSDNFTDNRAAYLGKLCVQLGRFDHSADLISPGININANGFEFTTKDILANGIT